MQNQRLDLQRFWSVDEVDGNESDSDQLGGNIGNILQNALLEVAEPIVPWGQLALALIQPEGNHPPAAAAEQPALEEEDGNEAEAVACAQRQQEAADEALARAIQSILDEVPAPVPEQASSSDDAVDREAVEEAIRDQRKKEEEEEEQRGNEAAAAPAALADPAAPAAPAAALQGPSAAEPLPASVRPRRCRASHSVVTPSDEDSDDPEEIEVVDPPATNEDDAGAGAVRGRPMPRRVSPIRIRMRRFLPLAARPRVYVQRVMDRRHQERMQEREQEREQERQQDRRRRDRANRSTFH